MPILGVPPPARPAMSSHAQRMPETDSPATIRDRGAVGAVLLTVTSCRRSGGRRSPAPWCSRTSCRPGRSGWSRSGRPSSSSATSSRTAVSGRRLIRQGAPSDGRASCERCSAVQLGDGDAPRAGHRGGRAPGRNGRGRSPRSWPCSLPLLALRAPHAIALERELRYAARSRRWTSPNPWSYYGWAIGAVWLGWGVWGLASAAVVRALTGSVLDDDRVAPASRDAAPGRCDLAVDARFRHPLPGGRPRRARADTGGQPGGRRPGRRAVARLLVAGKPSCCRRRSGSFRRSGASRIRRWRDCGHWARTRVHVVERLAAHDRPRLRPRSSRHWQRRPTSLVPALFGAPLGAGGRPDAVGQRRAGGRPVRSPWRQPDTSTPSSTRARRSARPS